MTEFKSEKFLMSVQTKKILFSGKEYFEEELTKLEIKPSNNDSVVTFYINLKKDDILYEILETSRIFDILEFRENKLLFVYSNDDENVNIYEYEFNDSNKKELYPTQIISRVNLNIFKRVKIVNDGIIIEIK